MGKRKAGCSPSENAAPPVQTEKIETQETQKEGVFRKLVSSVKKFYTHNEGLRHGRLASTVAGVAVLAVAGGTFQRSLSEGELIFRGNIDGYRIEYLENVGFFNEANKMILNKGSTTYEFFDETNRTLLDWRAQGEFSEDSELERVVYNRGRDREEFTRNNIDNGTIDGKYAGGTFDLADESYRSFRIRIRETLRKERGKALRNVWNGLPNKFLISRTPLTTYPASREGE